MKLVRMNGGLGNQVFQYVFMRYLELSTGEDCVIEDTAFFAYTEEDRNNLAHNGYQLERIFGIKKKRLSQIMDSDVFADLVKLSNEAANPGEKRRGIIPVFKESGMDLFTVQEGDIFDDECQYCGNSFSVPLNQFSPVVKNFRGDIYYYGYWINAGWFASFANDMLKELTFPAITDEQNRKYIQMIRDAGEHSVAFHIRRGDFVTVGWVLDSSRYAGMIEKIRTKVEKPVFFVFSDDIPWVREHYREVGLKDDDEIIYVEGNIRETSYIDMQLMKECRGMVFPNSSFSYLASFLNTRPDKVAVQPTDRVVIQYS